MSTIELRGVSKRFGATPVLTGVDLVVPDGSTTAVLGASGSGKTTLLRLIAGFEHVDEGTVAIDGRVVDDGVRSVRTQHRGVGYVPQEGALFPHLTVMGNVGFGVSRHEHAKVAELVELVGLGGMGRRYPHQLSGGQQQRVALARALIMQPSAVLLDEPFSSLDASLRTGLRRDVARILAETRTTTVLVTHDQDEALALADQIAVLRQGQVVVSADPHELYRDPPDLTAATSIGEANILAAVVRENQARCVLGAVRLHSHRAVADGPAQLLLRPEQLVLHLERGHDMVGAVVVDSQFHGHDTMVDLVVDDPTGQALLARVPGDLVLTPGQPVWIEVQGPGRVWSLDGHGAHHHDRHGAHHRDGHGAHHAERGARSVAEAESLWLPPPDPPAPSAPRVGAPGASGPRVAAPPRRRHRKVPIVLLAIGVAVLVAALLMRGGNNAAAVGPVVFHATLTVSGEIHAQENFTDKTTATKVSSCAQAATQGDRPQMGRNTWLVPTPTVNNPVEIEIGTKAGGYRGPGTYSQGAMAQGNGAMDVGPESYDLVSSDATASMTVNADGSGAVTFTHVPGDDDNPHAGWHGGITGSIAWTCTS
jgi:iron(III) transport system ATP-binding protein